MFNLPGRGFRQRITLTSSVPMTLNDVIVHVRQFVSVDGCSGFPDPDGFFDYIICKREDEENNSMPFLDAKFTRKEDGSVKSTVYRKKTHSDQYLNFAFHHPKHQTLGGVRTLMSRRETITSEEGDKKEEVEHLRGALSVCVYPSWAL